MNKSFSGQQLFLHFHWYKEVEKEIITKQMYYLRSDPQTNKISSI